MRGSSAQLNFPVCISWTKALALAASSPSGFGVAGWPIAIPAAARITSGMAWRRATGGMVLASKHREWAVATLKRCNRVSSELPPAAEREPQRVDSRVRIGEAEVGMVDEIEPAEQGKVVGELLAQAEL